MLARYGEWVFLLLFCVPLAAGGIAIKAMGGSHPRAAKIVRFSSAVVSSCFLFGVLALYSLMTRAPKDIATTAFTFVVLVFFGNMSYNNIFNNSSKESGGEEKGKP